MVAPTDVSELRALLGTYNYYLKFIKNFARNYCPAELFAAERCAVGVV
jgi:hypothetical protein